MYRFTKTALGLTLGLTVAFLANGPAPLGAQSGLNVPPVPGPYPVMIRPQPAPAPFVRPAYNQPMPYWMQNQASQNAQVPGAPPQAPANRAPQQPFIQGWNWSPQPPNTQTGNQNYGYGNRPAPGFFPGYATGQQGFGPMAPPWGNNWNNNGYGYPQGYPAPPQPKQ